MQNLKESWQNLPEKTRTLIKVLAGGTVVIALIAILALNLGKNKDYSTLFTGLNQEESACSRMRGWITVSIRMIIRYGCRRLRWIRQGLIS